MTKKTIIYILFAAVFIWALWWGLEFLHWHRIEKSFEYSMNIHRKSGDIDSYLNAKKFDGSKQYKESILLYSCFCSYIFAFNHYLSHVF